MFVLLVSLVTPLLGALTLPLSRRLSGAPPLLDGFALAAVASVVLLHLLPEAIATLGLWAVGLFLLGLLAPAAVEAFVAMRTRRGHQHGVGMWVLLAVAVAVHEFFDGTALGVALADASAGLGLADVLDGGVLDAHTGHDHAGHDHAGHDHAGHAHDAPPLVESEAHDHHPTGPGMLALATMLHRLPLGITVGWMIGTRFGAGRAWAVLLGMSGMTLLGYLFGTQGVEVLSPDTVVRIEAVMAGALLHVLFHHAPGTVSGRWARPLSAAGAVAGFAVAAAMLALHPSHATSPWVTLFLDALWSLSLESAPALLLAFVGGGLLHGFVSSAAMEWLARGSRWSQSLRGMAFGLPLPICSCGTLPLYRTLIRAGAPPSAAMAFLVATPEIGIDAVLLSIPLLGPELTVTRVIAAGLATLAVAAIVAPMVQLQLPLTGTAQVTVASGTVRERLSRGLRFGLGELVDHTLPWIVVGLLAAAMIVPFVDADSLAGLPKMWAVPALALLGMPMYVCASGATPFVAVLVAAGLSPGAAIAFLLTGPATNVSSFGVLSALHGRRVALAFSAAMVLVAIALGYLVDAIFGGTALAAGAGDHDHHGFLQHASLVAVAVLGAVAFVRLGPRAMLAEVLPSWLIHSDGCGHDHADGHHHGDASGHCGHAHVHGPDCAHTHGDGPTPTAVAPRIVAPGRTAGHGLLRPPVRRPAGPESPPKEPQ